ncbi:MAG: hypothetical protein ACRERV_10915, partial [Methylococcales bacterium]
EIIYVSEQNWRILDPDPQCDRKSLGYLTVVSTQLDAYESPVVVGDALSASFLSACIFAPCLTGTQVVREQGDLGACRTWGRPTAVVGNRSAYFRSL